MLYFAYGSNLWSEQMQLRCPEHRLIGSGRLDGYRWIINDRGYASIILSPKDYVLGLVYDISRLDELALDNYEGVYKGNYYKKQIDVSISTIQVSCMTYIDPVTKEGKPYHEYIRRINYGIIDAGLSEEYVEHYIRRFVPEC